MVKAGLDCLSNVKHVYTSQYVVELAFLLARLRSVNVPSKNPRLSKTARISAVYLKSGYVAFRRQTCGFLARLRSVNVSSKNPYFSKK